MATAEHRPLDAITSGACPRCKANNWRETPGLPRLAVCVGCRFYVTWVEAYDKSAEQIFALDPDRTASGVPQILGKGD